MVSFFINNYMNFISLLNLSFFSHQYMLIICLFITIFVFFITIYIFYYNFYNTIFYTHFYLEFFWTFFPILIVLLLFLPLFFYNDMFWNSQFHLFFIANQWFWEILNNDSFISNFSSLNLSLNIDNTLFIPLGCFFNFYLTSADVLHAFSIPSLYTMSDCVPGLLSLVSLSFPLIGLYILYCGQICGVNHSNMPLYFICFN